MPSRLQKAIETLLRGGRVLRFCAAAPQTPTSTGSAMGLGQALLVSGLRQIGRDLQVMEALLNPPPSMPLLFLLLEGRCRELRAARNLLLWIWGPLQMGLADAVPLRANSETMDHSPPASARTRARFGMRSNSALKLPSVTV